MNPYFEVRSAKKIDAKTWHTISELQVEATEKTLRRSRKEAFEIVGALNFSRYLASHKNPNEEVGKLFNPNQHYRKPTVALAVDNKEIIGYMYSALNVSGPTRISRSNKRLFRNKEYVWIREVAVRPDYQQQHIATRLGRISLIGLNAEKPVSTYGWPDEIGFLERSLIDLGFVKTDEEPHKLGGSSENVKLVRYQNTVGLLLKKLNQKIMDSRSLDSVDLPNLE